MTITTERMTTTINKEEFIRHFNSPGSPIAFSSPYRVYKHYKGVIPLKKIKQWMHGLDAYTLHKQAKKPKPRNPTFVYRKRYQFQIDLIELGRLSEYNDDIRYLLTAIDIFTRYAFVEPLKNKTASVFLEGFKKIMEKAGQFPSKILADRGSEIKNKHMQQFCRENNIKLLHSDNFVHAPFIERFNRTLKNLMYRYMTSRETDRFIDVLPALVNTYNTRQHRMIGMTPTEAENPENATKVRNTQEKWYSKRKRKPPLFKKGQTVRISKLKGQFDKGYDEQFLEEIYKIKNVFTRLPIPTYELQTLDEDEVIEGNFYGNELTPVDEPEIFKIEKILRKKRDKKTKKNLVYVKWKGYRNPSWIPEENVMDITSSNGEKTT